MRLTLTTTKAVTALVVSLWMAALACLMGCTQPLFFNSPAKVEASASQRNSVNQTQPDLMADMESCHHAGSNCPAPSNDKRPPSNGTVSCCPLEITVTPKW